MSFIDIISYSPNRPFLFNDILFWVFFALVLFVYSILYKNRAARNAYLFLVSVFFYYKTGGIFFSLLIISTLIDYTIGLSIYKAKSKPVKKWLVFISLFANLGMLVYFKYSAFFITQLNHFIDFLATNDIAYFSHRQVVDVFSQWINNLFDAHLTTDDIILPVGISFFTFQTISYTLDVYRNKVKPVRNIIDFAFYVSFFPQLVAGPIVRAAEFIPQLYQEYKLTTREMSHALFLIISGLIKKILIADFIAHYYVQKIISNPESYNTGFEFLMGAYGYAVQIYCDFSGYTDIAIGLAMLLGFRLPLNFYSPYKAINITDFWRRWHISLSSWLRDYLYIPLGGNRKSSLFVFILAPFIYAAIVLLPDIDTFTTSIFVSLIVFWILNLRMKHIVIQIISWAHFIPLLVLTSQSNIYGFGLLLITLINWIIIYFRPDSKPFFATMINLMLTMLLGGLWHGASMNFIIWGGLHGFALAAHKLWMHIRPNQKQKKGISKFFAVSSTFHFVTFAWIFFFMPDFDSAIVYIEKLMLPTSWDQLIERIYYNGIVFSMIVITLIIHWLPSSWKEYYRGLFIKLNLVLKLVVILIIIFLSYQILSISTEDTNMLNEFIYYQF